MKKILCFFLDEPAINISEDEVDEWQPSTSKKPPRRSIYDAPTPSPNSSVTYDEDSDAVENTSSAENDDETSLEDSFAVSLAKEETKDTTSDHVAAQHKRLLLLKQKQIQAKLATTKVIYFFTLDPEESMYATAGLLLFDLNLFDQPSSGCRN